MDFDQQIREAKKHFQPSTDLVSFRARVFDAVHSANVPTRTRSNIKSKALLASIALVSLPLAGFTYAYITFDWNRALFEFIDNTKPNGNVFTAADPAFLWSINTAGDKTVNLSQARSIAHFPIRTLESEPNWNKIVSEGVVPKITEINGTTVSVGQGPIYYLDVYTNDKGQRVGVTQELNADITSVENNQKMNVGFLYSKYSKTLSGFGNDVAVFTYLGVGGPWKDSNAPNAFAGTSWAAQGERKEIDLYHREKTGAVTLIKLYGDTDLTTLETFAHWYLQSSPQ